MPRSSHASKSTDILDVNLNVWRIMAIIMVPFCMFWVMNRGSPSLFIDSRLIRARDAAAERLGNESITVKDLDKQMILDAPLSAKAQCLLIMVIMTYVGACFFFVKRERREEEKKRFEKFFNGKKD